MQRARRLTKIRPLRVPGNGRSLPLDCQLRPTFPCRNIALILALNQTTGALHFASNFRVFLGFGYLPMQSPFGEH